MSRDIGKDLEGVDSQFHYDEVKSKWSTSPGNKDSPFSQRVILSTQIKSKPQKISRFSQKQKNGTSAHDLPEKSKMPLQLSNLKANKQKCDQKNENSFLTEESLLKSKIKGEPASKKKPGQPAPSMSRSPSPTLVQTDICKQEKLSNNQRIDSRYILDFYTIGKDPDTVLKIQKKQISEELAPIESKLKQLMKSCDQDNPNMFNRNALDMNQIENLDDLAQVFGLRTKPYSKKNIRMNMSTVREFLEGDTVTRLEIFEEKEKIKRKVEKRLKRERKIKEELEEEQKRLREAEEEKANALRVKKLRKDLEARRKKRLSKVSSGSKVTRLIVKQAKSSQAGRKNSDNLCEKEKKLKELKIQNIKNINQDKLKNIRNQILITESTNIPTQQTPKNSASSSKNLDIDKKYFLKKSLSISKTHLLFLQGNLPNYGNANEPPQIYSGRDSSLDKSEADNKNDSQELQSPTLVNQNIQSNISLPFLFQNNLKGATSQNQKSPKLKNGNLVRKKYMLKENFKSKRKDESSNSSYSRVKSVLKKQSSIIEKNKSLEPKSTSSIPAVKKKVTFIPLNGSSRRKAKHTRPPNWNGLDALNPVNGIRGYGFSGNKSGCYDIKHFIRQQKRKQNKSFQKSKSKLQKVQNESFASKKSLGSYNQSDKKPPYKRMTSLETIDEYTLNSIFERSNFPFSPSTTRRIIRKQNQKPDSKVSLERMSDFQKFEEEQDAKKEQSYGQLGFNTEFSLHHISRVDPKFKLLERTQNKGLRRTGKTGKKRGDWRNSRVGRKYKTKDDVLKIDQRIIGTLKRKIDEMRQGQIGTGVYFIAVDNEQFSELA